MTPDQEKLLILFNRAIKAACQWQYAVGRGSATKYGKAEAFDRAEAKFLKALEKVGA